jgi:hypothetical protein
LESQPHLKWAMVDGAMESLVVVVLNIGKTLNPCTQIPRVVHAQNVHNHPIENLWLAIGLGWKAMDLVSLVSNNDQRLDQNALRN